jgi:SpoVK/Ycf46/Vps4 family AAA+-type ATPase
MDDLSDAIGNFKAQLESEIKRLEKEAEGNGVSKSKNKLTNSMNRDSGSEQVLEPESDLEIYSRPVHLEIRSLEKPEWPVTSVVLANAGPLAPVLKAFLDELEPLVGLIADEESVAADRVEKARDLLAAYGYLNIIAAIFHAASMGHRADFKDFIAQRLLRTSWIDEGIYNAGEKIGWHVDDDYPEVPQEIGVLNRISGLSSILYNIEQKYQELPLWHMRESALIKLFMAVSRLINFPPERMLEAFSLQPRQTDDEWLAFLATFQSTGFESLVEVLKKSIATLSECFESDGDMHARAVLLVHFAGTFKAPFTLNDMRLWKSVARETLEKLRGHELYGPVIARFYKDPYAPQNKTEFPDPAVFEEIVDDLEDVGLEPIPTYKNVFQVIRTLIFFEYSVVVREHFASSKVEAELHQQWQKYYDFAHELFVSEHEQSESLINRSFLEEIGSLIGLEKIKSRLNDLAEIAISKNAKNLPPLRHMIFSGNPGTGKTTVAEMLGKIYSTLGLLPQGQVISVTRSDLVAEYTGQTAPKVAEAVRKALGGILFIDEAYTLKRSSLGESDSFGQEAIDALLTYMEQHRGNLLVITAGYPAEMKIFLDSNPGLASRLPDVWQFDDYSEPDLLRILDKFASEESLTLGEGVEQAFTSVVVEAKKKPNFSNARWVRNVFEEALVKRALRASNLDAKEPFAPSDFVTKKEPVELSAQSREAVASKLDGLLGLESVKNDIFDLIAFQTLQIRRAKQGLPTSESSLSHIIFKGPPGTGKTTVARLIGQLYKEMGLLNSGHVVEVQRADLVAGFIGQTAIKTESAIQRAMGGVLFIDEAYSLTAASSAASGNDFGSESVDTILKYMEDRKGQFVVIAAGYDKEMDAFIDSNPGLASRFGKRFNFVRWTPEIFVQDVMNKLEAHKYIISQEAEKELTRISTSFVLAPKFSSGRTSRTFIEILIESQSRRLIDQPEADLTELKVDDFLVSEAKINDSLFGESKSHKGTVPNPKTGLFS